MKKIKKIKTKDNLFIHGIISLDDKKNLKYFDKLSYENYLKNLNIGDDKNNGKKRNCNYISRTKKKCNSRKNKKWYRNI